MALVDLLNPKQVEVYLSGFNTAFADTTNDVVTVNTDPVWCAGYSEGLKHALHIVEDMIEAKEQELEQMLLPLSFPRGWESVDTSTEDTVKDPRD